MSKQNNKKMDEKPQEGLEKIKVDEINEPPIVIEDTPVPIIKGQKIVHF